MILTIDNISKSYGSRKALDGVSFAIEEGSIFGLLGPNGAGKTTLLRILNGIVPADGGTILFDGNPIAPSDIRQMGYLPEERGLYRKMKVGEQLLYLTQLKGLKKQEAEKRLKGWFEHFDIADWWNRKVGELSKGMQQKVQYITAVVHEPRLVILDEPFSGLDPVNALLLKQEIMQLHEKGTTVILSSHSMECVEELCDHIALLDHAKVVLTGDLEQLRRESGKSLNDIFLENVTI